MDENRGYNLGKDVLALLNKIKTQDVPIKSFLPETVKVPFYLSKTNRKELKSADRSERDSRRFHFLCSRDAMDTAKINKQAKMFSLMPQFQLSGREREIERNVMEPYENNPVKVTQLLETIDLKRRLVHEKQLETTEFIHPTEPRRTSPSFQERRSKVLARKTSILLDSHVQRQITAQKWNEKATSLAAPQLSITTNSAEANDVARVRARQYSWLVLVAALSRFKEIARVVLEAREMKAGNMHIWKYCVKIQKFWRSYKNRISVLHGTTRDETANKSMIKKIKSLIKNNDQEQQVFQTRKDAAKLLIQFLRDVSMGYRAIMLAYFRKLRTLQSRVRKHLSANRSRVEILKMFFEACLPALTLHVEIVLKGYGHDIGNVTSYDQSRIRVLQSHTSDFSRQGHLHTEMNQASFHEFLRFHREQLETALSIFTINGKMSCIYEVAVDSAMFDLLFRKRREFVKKLENSKKVVLQIPRFELRDAHAYICSDDILDPLSRLLAEVERKQIEEAEEANLRRHMKNSIRPTIASLGSVEDTRRLKEKQEKDKKIALVPHTPSELTLLLLRSLTPEDLTITYIQMAATTDTLRKEARREAKKQKEAMEQELVEELRAYTQAQKEQQAKDSSVKGRYPPQGINPRTANLSPSESHNSSRGTQRRNSNLNSSAPRQHGNLESSNPRNPLDSSGPNLSSSNPRRSNVSGRKGDRDTPLGSSGRRKTFINTSNSQRRQSNVGSSWKRDSSNGSNFSTSGTRTPPQHNLGSSAPRSTHLGSSGNNRHSNLDSSGSRAPHNLGSSNPRSANLGSSAGERRMGSSGGGRSRTITESSAKMGVKPVAPNSPVPSHRSTLL